MLRRNRFRSASCLNKATQRGPVSFSILLPCWSSGNFIFPKAPHSIDSPPNCYLWLLQGCIRLGMILTGPGNRLFQALLSFSVRADARWIDAPLCAVIFVELLPIWTLAVSSARHRSLFLSFGVSLLADGAKCVGHESCRGNSLRSHLNLQIFLFKLLRYAGRAGGSGHLTIHLGDFLEHKGDKLHPVRCWNFPRTHQRLVLCCQNEFVRHVSETFCNFETQTPFPMNHWSYLGSCGGLAGWELYFKSTFPAVILLRPSSPQIHFYVSPSNIEIVGFPPCCSQSDTIKRRSGLEIETCSKPAAASLPGPQARWDESERFNYLILLSALMLTCDFRLSLPVLSWRHDSVVAH